MPLPIEDLTPRQIVAELDRYIVGQDAAKRAVAVALRNRYRRQQLPESERDDIVPKNILMIGPTGVGKTEIARRLAQLARAPFVKVEATKFTEVGYVGRDVESMVRDLVSASVRLVERELMESILPEAEKRARERLADLIESSRYQSRSFVERTFDHPALRQTMEAFGWQTTDPESADAPIEVQPEEPEDVRAQVLEDLDAGKLESESVEFDSEESNSQFLQVFTPGGMEEMGIDASQMGGAFGSRRTTRRLNVADARQVLIDEEAKKLLDRAGVHREAVVRAEQTGIIFLDEIDKVAGKQGGSGPDVSREGVQRDLLPIIEGSTVASKFGPVRTDHILFIAAGAFHMSKPSDLIPELQGRLPIRVELDSLSQDDFTRILFEPKNALTKQYIRLLETEGVDIEFTHDGIEELASLAAAVNERTENIGARRLHTMMERLLEDVLYDAPEVETKRFVFDRAAVRARLEGVVKDEKLSRNVL